MRVPRVTVYTSIMGKNESHEVIAALKKLAGDLGRAPTRDEFRETGLEWASRRAFGESYVAALTAAGLGATRQVIDKSESKFKYAVTKMGAISVHKRPLGPLFKAAGNPDVLRMVSMPDTHVPYHDVPAVNAFCKFTRFYDPHILTIMGDFQDMEGISHWPSDDFNPRRLIPEMKTGRKVMAQVTDSCPNTVARYYLEGNHEDWLRQALVFKIPELADIGDLLPEGVDLDVRTMLNLDKLGFEYLPLNHLLHLGDAYLTHGIYTGEGHAKKHLTQFKANMFYGHIHDTASAVETGITGLIEAHSLGCLSRLDAKFMKNKINKFAHAFGIHEFFKDGSYTFYKPRINNGMLSYNGKIFDGNK